MHLIRTRVAAPSANVVRRIPINYAGTFTYVDRLFHVGRPSSGCPSAHSSSSLSSSDPEWSIITRPDSITMTTTMSILRVCDCQLYSRVELILINCCAGQARRMLRDEFTHPARRAERRPPLLSDRGERQGIRFILRHPHRQRYAPLCSLSLYCGTPVSSDINCHHPAAFFIIMQATSFFFSFSSLTSPRCASDTALCERIVLIRIHLWTESVTFVHFCNFSLFLFTEPVSMATVIAVVIACLFLILVVTLCLLYAYRSERCCFDRKFPFFPLCVCDGGIHFHACRTLSPSIPRSAP